MLIKRYSQLLARRLLFRARCVFKFCVKSVLSYKCKRCGFKAYLRNYKSNSYIRKKQRTRLFFSYISSLIFLTGHFHSISFFFFHWVFIHFFLFSTLNFSITKIHWNVVVVSATGCMFRKPHTTQQLRTTCSYEHGMKRGDQHMYSK